VDEQRSSLRKRMKVSFPRLGLPQVHEETLRGETMESGITINGTRRPFAEPDGDGPREARDPGNRDQTDGDSLMDLVCV